MNPKPGSFTPFLEYTKRRGGAPRPVWEAEETVTSATVEFSDLPPAEPRPSARAGAVPAAAAPVSPITVLGILARQIQGAMPYSDLQLLSGMDATRFREALMSLQSANAITIDPDQVLVRLTETGAVTANLARPS